MQTSQQPYQPHPENNSQQRLNRSQLLQIILGLIIGVGGFVGIVALLRFTPKDEAVTAASSTNSSSVLSVSSYFDAAALAGKGPKEVEIILGPPTDSWIPRSGADNLMQSYSLGEEMTVEFHRNRIGSLVIFFNQKNVDVETAYRLIGLDYGKPKPSGVSRITTGEDWIKVFY